MSGIPWRVIANSGLIAGTGVAPFAFGLRINDAELIALVAVLISIPVVVALTFSYLAYMRGAENHKQICEMMNEYIEMNDDLLAQNGILRRLLSNVGAIEKREVTVNDVLIAKLSEVTADTIVEKYNEVVEELNKLLQERDRDIDRVSQCLGDHAQRIARLGAEVEVLRANAVVLQRQSALVRGGRA